MARALKPCGTRAAYLRHLSHREAPCQACKAANAANSRRQLEWHQPDPPLRHTSRTDLYPVISALARLLDPGGPDVPFSAPREWLHECGEGL